LAPRGWLYEDATQPSRASDRAVNVIYVFGGLMSVGIVIFAHRPWWLLIWVPLIPPQVFRVRKEEQVLEAKFGDAYRDYKRRTWF
jgi:protein-S-isoprenylcysteine O-methyltransferase Ste14